MALFNYLKDTQRFLREQNQVFENPEDLIAHINRARRMIALQTQCIRVLTPSSGAISGYSVTNAGSGYSATPTITVTAPDFPSGMLPNPNGLQATAEAIVNGGEIEQIYPIIGGEGYFSPTVTITDDTGEDAEAEAIVTNINTLNQGQEVYPFSGIDLSGNPGCESVFAVKGISIIYSGYRYSLECLAFSRYQIYRAYPYQYQYTPAICSQRGQGTGGDFYFYPIPSQTIQAEWDVFCLPSDLTDDQSVEAIPAPWGDAVAFAACHYAMLGLQNYNASKFFMELYDKYLMRYSQTTRVGRGINQYGRPVLAALTLGASALAALLGQGVA